MLTQGGDLSCLSWNKTKKEIKLRKAAVKFVLQKRADNDIYHRRERCKITRNIGADSIKFRGCYSAVTSVLCVYIIKIKIINQTYVMITLETTLYDGKKRKHHCRRWSGANTSSIILQYVFDYEDIFRQSIGVAINGTTALCLSNLIHRNASSSSSRRVGVAQASSVVYAVVDNFGDGGEFNFAAQARRNREPGNRRLRRRFAAKWWRRLRVVIIAVALKFIARAARGVVSRVWASFAAAALNERRNEYFRQRKASQ